MDVENDQRDIGARYNERDIGAQDKERDIGSQKPLVEDSGSQGFNEGAEGAKSFDNVSNLNQTSKRRSVTPPIQTSDEILTSIDDELGIDEGMD